MQSAYCAVKWTYMSYSPSLSLSSVAYTSWFAVCLLDWLAGSVWNILCLLWVVGSFLSDVRRCHICNPDQVQSRRLIAHKGLWRLHCCNASCGGSVVYWLLLLVYSSSTCIRNCHSFVCVRAERLLLETVVDIAMWLFTVCWCWYIAYWLSI